MKNFKGWLGGALVLSLGLFTGLRAPADIVTLDTDQADYTFYGTNTYFVTNLVTIFGTATIEGGTVVKYGPAASLSVYGVACETAFTNPAVFTARDDDTVGETLPGSTHSPAGYYANPPLKITCYADLMLHDLDFYHASTALELHNLGEDGYRTYSLWNVTMQDCGFGIDCEDGGQNNLCLTNLTMIDCADGIAGDYMLGGVAVNSTFINVGGLVFDPWGYGFYPFNFSWCTFSNVALDAWEVDIGGDHNRFADCSPFSDYDNNNLDGLEQWGHWTNFFGSDWYYMTNLDVPLEFSIAATNNYTRYHSTPVTLDVRAGVPLFQAVLVDGDDFSNATWTAYTSSNLLVDLGMTEGWHDVRIGLQSWSETAAPVWQWKRLKLDTVAPQVFLTNPTNRTGARPLVQLYGYAGEALASLAFDVSNATSQVTDTPGFVTGQHYDTNTWEFTTNHFRCYDLVLTNGVNTVTLRAADEAGNVTVTNFDLTLDYAGATNPPAIRVDWPQDGMRVNARDLTWQGWVGDPTAMVTATVGGSNAVGGLVERNGNFWVEHLALAPGTNELELTVRDAAGNVSVTNVVVVQTNFLLTLNPVAEDKLWEPAADVGGSIDDPDYTVWINGVAGTNHGDGTWSADNVPLTSGGVAVFNLTAYPPGETPSGGGGGGGGEADDETGDGHGGESSGGAPALNPFTASGVNTNTAPDKPPKLYVVDSVQHVESHSAGVGGGWDIYSWDNNDQHWADNAGGGNTRIWGYYTLHDGVLDPSLTTSNESEYVWPATRWPELTNGWGTFLNDGIPGERGVEDPIVRQEHCYVNVPTDYYSGPDDHITGNYVRTADTQMKLRTGGKSVAQAQALFKLSCPVVEVLNLVGGPSFGTQPIPSSEVTFMGGSLDADGNRWEKLPEGVKLDATVTVKGRDYYIFKPAAPKYKLQVSAGSEIWWFNGESPSGYAMQTTASVSDAPSGATFSWLISGPAAIVGSSTNSSVTISGTGPSVSPDDVVVKVIVAGAAICQTNLTVLAPNHQTWQTNTDNPNGGGWQSLIRYKIYDQFNNILPSPVPWNEDIDGNGTASTAAQVSAAAISDFTGENWGWGGEGAATVDPNDAEDNFGRGGSGGTPLLENPQAPLGNTKVDHSPGGGWYVGSANIAKGVKVANCVWQTYQDHGRHQ